MDGAAATSFGFGVCAGSDLVTELPRSRLVGLRQKGFTPAAGRQERGWSAVGEGRKGFAPVTLALHSCRSWAPRNRMLVGWVYLHVRRTSVAPCCTHAHTYTHSCHPARWFWGERRASSFDILNVLLKYRRGFERERERSKHAEGLVLHFEEKAKEKEGCWFTV